MKIQNIRIVVTTFAIMILAFAAACGGGGGATPDERLSVNTLNGQTGIPVDSTFKYNFNQTINPSTVTQSTFFISPAPAAGALVVKDAFDDTICNPDNAVNASVVCNSTIECELDPAADLEENTRYAACLSDDILYATGTNFEGFMAVFTTAGGAAPVTFTSKLVRLDSTELLFTDKPIPRSIRVKYIPSTPLTSAADQQAFESAVSLKDGAGSAVAGSYAWAEDGSYAIFTPGTRLGYRTTYTVYNNGEAVADASFTTLTKNDINGDGFADLLAGTLYTAGMTRDGRLYIFYGTQTGIPTCITSAGCQPDARLLNTTTDEWLGISNKIVGDVNGDGYEDFIVGQPNKTSTNEGVAYLFAGGTDLTGVFSKSQALATITDSTATRDDLGYSVSGAGDMNGDKYDDVIIGAPGYGDYGKAYVFLGGTSLAGNLDVSAAGQTISGSGTEALGAMVDGVGDVNSDGFDDIILSGKGHAYIMYGKGALDSTRAASNADSVITSPDIDFGKSVSAAGDVNGDGKADVMAGKPTVNAGVVYVFLGNQLSGPVNAADASTIISETSGNDDKFGNTLTAAGDIDGDGKNDLLIGGDTASPGSDRGAAYVFLGKNLAAALTDADADTTIRGNLTNVDLLSLGLSGWADFNNDGFDDIVLGAPQYWTPANKGFVYIFNGSTSGIASCTFTAPADCSPNTTLTGVIGDKMGFMGTTEYTLP
jgi:hypothetical protein